jgi:hypothetical protein
MELLGINVVEVNPFGRGVSKLGAVSAAFSFGVGL